MAPKWRHDPKDRSDTTRFGRSKGSKARQDDDENPNIETQARQQREVAVQSNFQSDPRSTTAPYKALPLSEEDTQKNRFDNFETHSHIQPRPRTRSYASGQTQSSNSGVSRDQSSPPTPATTSFDDLPPTVVQFCNIGLKDYDRCAKFAHRKLELWANLDRLPSFAKYFLHLEKANIAQQVVSRYWMLTSSLNGQESANPAMHKAHHQWLQRLAVDEDAQEEFEKGCIAIYTGICEEIESMPRPTTSSSVQQIQTQQLAEIQDRHGSTASRSNVVARPSIATRESRTYNMAGSIDENMSRTSLDMIPEDIDSGSAPGGKIPAGQSGPDSDVIVYMDPVLQNSLREDYKLYTGKIINDVFGPGCVISLLWHENLGSKKPSSSKFADLAKQQPKEGRMGPGHVTQSRPYGEYIFSHIRRFVIVVQRRGHSIGIPITSYSNHGLSAKNLADVEQRAHAIIYASGQKPRKLQEEPKFSKQAIEVDILNTNETLSAMSRLYYGKCMSIEHNVKVNFIGRVIEDHRRRLLETWLAELQQSLEL